MDIGVLSRIDTQSSLLIANASRAGGMPRATSRNTDQSSVHLRAIRFSRRTLASPPRRSSRCASSSASSARRRHRAVASMPRLGQRRNKRSLRIPRVIRFSLTRELYGPEEGYIEALDLSNSHLGRCVPSVCTQTTQQTGKPSFEFAWQRIILMILQRQKRGGCAAQ
jgi:hypothetical protein